MDYGAIVRRSIEVVKKNKWLIVYGMILAGTGFDPNGGSSGSDDNNKEKTIDAGKEISQRISDVPQVLADYTSRTLDWLKSVPPTTWLLLILALLLVILAAITIGFVLNSWAKASLITGINKALRDEETNLANTSPAGIAKIKPLIGLSVVMTLVVLGLIFGIPLTWVLIYLVIQSIAVLKYIWIFIGILGGIVLIFASIILLSMTNMYAERLVILKNFAPGAAFKKGFSLSRKGFIPTLVMGLINFISQLTVGCLSVILIILLAGVPLAVYFIPKFQNGNFPSALELTLAFIFVLVFIAALKIIGGIMLVFTNANWNQLFESVYSKMEEGENNGNK